MSDKWVWHSNILSQNLFILIVRGDFCCINHRVSHDVWSKTTPEVCYTTFSDCLSIAVNTSIVWSLIHRQLTLSLHSNFHNISWICNCDSNSSCCQSSQDLLEQSWILTWLQLTANNVSDWNVQTNTESSEDELTLKPRRQPTKQGHDSFFRGDLSTSSKESLVPWNLSLSGLLKLQSHLGSIQRNGSGFSPHASGWSHKATSDEECGFSLSLSLLYVHGIKCKL